MDWPVPGTITKPFENFIWPVTKTPPVVGVKVIALPAAAPPVVAELCIRPDAVPGTTTEKLISVPDAATTRVDDVTVDDVTEDAAPPAMIATLSLIVFR